MKKNFGSKNWMFPMPVLMIATYGEDGTPDVMNAAWGGITLEDEITICIDTSHRTWANIAAKKAFTVAFGTADTVKSCDYLGTVSGNRTPDKVARSGARRQRTAARPRMYARLDERGELQRGRQDRQLRRRGVRSHGRQARRGEDETDLF